MTNPFSQHGNIPASEPVPAVTYSPLTLTVPGRPAPLELKVSMPATGTNLPVILLSHGHGRSYFLSSLRGYGPLVDFWAEHGFIVIQPTHLDSTALGLRDEPLPDAPTFWRDRATDMHFILDNLDEIEGRVPGLAGRMDKERVAAVGHSLGGHTVGLLLGMRVEDPGDSRARDLSDPRIKAGVIIAAPGVADEHLGNWVSTNYPMNRYIDFSAMKSTALVVAGDKDINLNFSSRLSYRWDAYTHSPAGNKTLLMMKDAEHIFGGISGYDAGETTDGNPERVAVLRALIWAYLRSQLYPGDDAWSQAKEAFERQSSGSVESR